MKHSGKPTISYMKKARKAGELLESGMPLQQVAKKVKCHVQTLKGWAGYFKWQLPAPLPTKAAIYQQARQQKLKAHAEQCSQVKMMLEAGSSQPAVRETLKLSYPAFYKHLKRLAILPDAIVRSNTNEKARQLYELADMEPDAIEKQLQLPPGTVKKWVSYGRWTNDKPTMADVQWQAQVLYESKGMQQQDIAASIGVSPSTIGNWRKRFNWKRLSQKPDSRTRARQLYEKEGLEQRQIAQQLAVSEKTISKWKKRYQWQKLAKSNDSQTRARQLYENESLLLKQIAQQLNISKKTIGTWKKRCQWQKLTNNTATRNDNASM